MLNLSKNSVKNAINGLLPDNKTSLFFALLILALASVFLWYKRLDGMEWSAVSGYIMTVYVVRRIKGEVVRKDVNKAYEEGKEDGRNS